MLLIGILGETPNEITATTSFFGGKPVFYKDHLEPVCKLCGNRCVFVCQLYCPLAFQPFHRTLYVFTCVKRNCWNKAQSWSVYRQEKFDAIFNDSSDSDLDSDSSWGVDENIWSGASDAEKDERLVTRHDEQAPSDEASRERMERSKSPLNICKGVSDMNIDEEIFETLKASVETTQKLRDEVKFSKFKKSLLDEEIDSNIIFDCKEINAEECDESKAHKKARAVPSVEGISIESKNPDDKYVKTLPPHGDVIFHKFLMKLNEAPQQVLRYDWCGIPLLIKHSDEKERNSFVCKYCGEKCVFEFQLLPTLVNYLKTPANITAVEFGTVCFYSCRNSCWSKEDDDAACCFKEEHIFLQSDPDQELFELNPNK